MSETIVPRTLKGFRDLEPGQVLQRNRIVRTAQEHLEAFGFQPIATPVLEYAEILLGKGGGETDKQVYRFEDGGARDVAMRYDLTVPLARYCASRAGRLSLPFRGYQIGLVWRGEKSQRGRYREFMQCDFDILGTTSSYADAEVLTMAATLVGAFFNSGFEVRASDRRLLKAFLEECGVADSQVGILRSLDKLAKQGRERTHEELVGELKLDADIAERLLAFAGISGPIAAVRSALSPLSKSPAVQAQIDRLEETLAIAGAAGIAPEQLKVDLSITRGLDYYTGVVFETFALGQESVGSICSGGRYDNLTGLYSKHAMPGVGGSVGIDRLLSLVEPDPPPAPTVVVVHFDAPVQAAALTASLRRAGISAEGHLEGGKLKAQMKYADRQNARLVAVVGGDESAEGCFQLKRLDNGETQKVPVAEAVSACQALLATPN